jgi:hypothetical protein
MNCVDIIQIINFLYYIKIVSIYINKNLIKLKSQNNYKYLKEYKFNILKLLYLLII